MPLTNILANQAVRSLGRFAWVFSAKSPADGVARNRSNTYFINIHSVSNQWECMIINRDMLLVLVVFPVRVLVWTPTVTPSNTLTRIATSITRVNGAKQPIRNDSPSTAAVHINFINPKHYILNP